MPHNFNTTRNNDRNITNKFMSICMWLLLSIALSSSVYAQDDDWGDDWDNDEDESPWVISGFIEGAYGHFTQQNVTPKSSPLSEIRTRIDVAYTHEKFDLIAKGELLFDDITSNYNASVRELYIKTSPFSYLDVKIGKQVLTWGTADYLFINDLFPKDWRSFFSGRDDEYLKAPSTSIKTSWFINDYTLDVAWTPRFTQDQFITGERFSFYSPEAQQQIAPKSFTTHKTNNDQWFVRLSTNKQGIEYALYGYKGYWTTPEGLNIQQQPYFPKMNSIGASIRTTLGNGIFNAEVASYNSTESSNGYNNTYYSPNSQQRFLIGYETELMKNVTLNAQYYIEHINAYSQLTSSHIQPSTLVSQNRQLITTRLRYSAMQQKLTLTLFNFYSPSEKDGFTKSSINYRYNDQWQYSIGANLFWGKEDFSFFGQHQKNSNVWARVRYQY